MNVLLVSTYESGFQSLGTSVAAAHLLEADVRVNALDLSVTPTPDIDDLCRHDLVGFHLPMFHSVPAAVRVAGRLRQQEKAPKIFFYGLYADLFREKLLGRHGDYVLGTDWEDQIVPLVKRSPDPSVVQLQKRGFARQNRYRTPARQVLPHLGNYAKLVEDGAHMLAGCVEATRGCAHHCTHCPIPPVYGGKVTIIPEEVVLADIDNLVLMGARHVSFVDPDFLNVPRHGLSIMKAVNDKYPFLTYDFVAKVSHFRRHEQYVRELAKLGLKFVLTAMEFNDNEVLDILKKKHDIDDLDWSIGLFHELGVHLKPTFVMVNPWAEVGDIMDLLEFVETRGLIDAVDPIQYKIRLLLFNNSPLMDSVGLYASLGEESDYYTEWRHRNPAVEELHREICRWVDEAVERHLSTEDIFYGVKRRVAERLPPGHRSSIGPAPVKLPPAECPRFNVPNYCCTEPTEGLEELKGLL
ncbi:hypothetical protein sce5621 [Sorangium cellulosum So ce56]|uniref:Radical SAM core domain-containing protein n=1 Tax=Sorangium cellulosum (strain So ce56) TaxID=448385 RepID=A9G3P3_SORC5|nr:radical SAM protein [Sorangium cellulosum]CAN95784.1 hypothetical protein sce5621 [Sorangium cellulosum So ce56]